MSDCCSSTPAVSTCCCQSPKEPVSIISKLSIRERLTDLMCRFSNRVRMNYRVDPGLYSLGKPTPESPVLVTANYRMSFNRIRSAMNNRNCWILVLDTKGINVWCAAGKGSFGTKELINRISDVKLSSVISHRKLILPQLGASGIAAHKATKETGFSINYGPVRAEDIAQYIDNNYTATPQMRKVEFPFFERIVLIPIEVVSVIKKFIIFLIVSFLLFGATRTGIMYQNALNGVLPLIIGGLSAIMTGSILLPVLLPFLPGRSFALKGFFTGLAGLVVVLAIRPVLHNDPLLIALCSIAIPAWSSYQALLFTGSSTYASPSGVKTELRISLPIYIGAAIISLLLLIAKLIHHWGLL